VTRMTCCCGERQVSEPGSSRQQQLTIAELQTCVHKTTESQPVPWKSLCYFLAVQNNISGYMCRWRCQHRSVARVPCSAARHQACRGRPAWGTWHHWPSALPCVIQPCCRHPRLFVSPLVTKASYDYLQVFSRPHMYSYLSLLWEGARMTSGARLQASYMSSHCLTVARQFLSIVMQGQVQRRLQQQVD